MSRNGPTKLSLVLQERFELLVEPAKDTKVLLCWNTDTVHLSFRGTASMTNVLADLQVRFACFLTYRTSIAHALRASTSAAQEGFLALLIPLPLLASCVSILCEVSIPSI